MAPPGDELDYSLTITRACNFLQVKAKSGGSCLSQLPGITTVGPAAFALVNHCQPKAVEKRRRFWGTILDFSGATNIEYACNIRWERRFITCASWCPGAAANLRGLCVYSDASNMHGLPACQLLVQNVWLTNLYKGIVFGNNAYIQSWHSITVRGCFGRSGLKPPPTPAKNRLLQMPVRRQQKLLSGVHARLPRIVRSTTVLARNRTVGQYRLWLVRP